MNRESLQLQIDFPGREGEVGPLGVILTPDQDSITINHFGARVQVQRLVVRDASADKMAEEHAQAERDYMVAEVWKNGLPEKVFRIPVKRLLDEPEGVALASNGGGTPDKAPLIEIRLRLERK